MLLVAPVNQEIRREPEARQDTEDLLLWVNEVRSEVPAITHVDYSARIQTVTAERNGRYYDLIKAFDAITNCGLIINTSFNVRGEPIVCTPEDAYRCFMRTEMDYLVLEDYVLDKKAQAHFEDAQWKQEFVLD